LIPIRKCSVQEEMTRTRHVTIVVRRDISPNCSKLIKRRSSSKNKQVQESSDDDDDNHKGKNKSFERKKSYNKKFKHFTKKKSNTKRSFMVGTQEWVTNVSSSDDESSENEDIVGVAITNHKIQLPPPPICLMAKDNSKVSDGESDDELDPNKFSNLIHEYTCIIKREKCKVKKLESAHTSLELSHNDLLTKYNALLRSMMSHLHSSTKLVINMTNSSLSMWN
jgi:hypothetical protein